METVTTILQEMLVNFLQFLPKAIVAMVVFFLSIYVAGVVARFVHRALDRRKADHEVNLVLTKVTRWSIIILGIFVALQQMGFDLSAFLVSLGVVGFTIGFALQDISKNFIAGMLILFQQPFDIGDAIKVEDYIGTVINVDLRATEIRTFDGMIVLIPNADVYTSPITNYSRETNRRLELTLGVAYGTDLDLVKNTVMEVVTHLDLVLSDPAPEIAFDKFSASSIDFTLFYWFNAKEQSLLAVRDAVILAVNTAFAEKGIDIPYPTQTVLMKQ